MFKKFSLPNNNINIYSPRQTSTPQVTKTAVSIEKEKIPIALSEPENTILEEKEEISTSQISFSSQRMPWAPVR